MREPIIIGKEGEKTAKLFSREGGDLEVYADGAWGFMISHSSTCKIDFYTTLMSNAENEVHREVAVRLVVPLPVLFGLRDFIDKQIPFLIEKGVIEAVPTPADKAPASPPSAEPKPS